MNNHIKRRGILIILTSPSGAGKTTVATALLNADINLHKSISATTRLPRPQEEHGKDYVFISKDEFLHHVDNDNFAEHANVFGNHYGTFKSTVDEALENGRDVLFVIDWQGTQQLAQAYAHDMVRIFMLPPTFEDLKLRLENRKSDPPDVINQRLLKASDEMSHWAEYDYVVINKDLDHTIDAIHSIIKSERLRRLRQVDLIDFINTLRNAGDAYGEN
jgi:guanylate kinase